MAIYPKEGTFWHDDPFIVMASASSDEQQAAEQFFNFLLTPDSQKLAMSYGFRPANVDVPLADPVSAAYGVQPQGVQNILPIPSAEVIVEAKKVWGQNRKRADIVLVVDVSGSMEENGKLDQAKAGLGTFLQRILPEDRVGLVTFSSTAQVAVDPAPLGQNRVALDDAIQAMRPTGKTAIYDGLMAGKQALDALPRRKRRGADQGDCAADRWRGERQQDLIRPAEAVVRRDRRQHLPGGLRLVTSDQDAATKTLQSIVDFSKTILVKGDTGEIGSIFDNLSRYF